MLPVVEALKIAAFCPKFRPDMNRCSSPEFVPGISMGRINNNASCTSGVGWSEINTGLKCYSSECTQFGFQRVCIILIYLPKWGPMGWAITKDASL